MSRTEIASAEACFKKLWTGSPLQTLNSKDRDVVCQLITSYALSLDRNRGWEFDEELLELSRLAARVDLAATKLERHIRLRQLQWRESLVHLELQAEIAALRSHSVALGRLLQIFGKPGHTRGMDHIFWLVTVSEFVRFKVGKYADEAIADLWQLFAASSHNGRARTCNLEGESILKRRGRLRKSHYGHYLMCLERAAMLAEIPAETWNAITDASFKGPRALETYLKKLGGMLAMGAKR